MRLHNLPNVDEEDWNVVIKECSILASKWEQLGGYLSLRFSLMNQIKHNSPGDNHQCLNEALMMWITQNYNTERFGVPSWRNLLDAMARVDSVSFKHLAAKHQGIDSIT